MSVNYEQTLNLCGLRMRRIRLFQLDGGCTNATAGVLAHGYNNIHNYSIVSVSMKYSYPIK